MIQSEAVLNSFDEKSLFVLDFSAIANIKSQDELDVITDIILKKNIKVAISREFYEDYDVIIKSVNEEQKSIAKKAYVFLNTMRLNDSLLYMSDIVDANSIVEKLRKNQKVCFVYYRVSEFAESVINNIDDLKAYSFVVDENGEVRFFDNNESLSDFLIIKIDECATDDDYFSIDFVPKEGEMIKTRDGEELTLSVFIGKGGEGTVFSCEEKDDYVIKIYNKGQLNRLRLKKLFLMESKQVRYDGVCWPEKVVFSKEGKPLGYMMKKVSGKPLSKVLESDEELLKLFPDWTKQNLLSLAIDILQKVQYLHLFGILIGDLRLKNIVINSEGSPCIVDVDSCQIDSLPCPIGYPDYTPPELQHVEFKKQLRSYYNESFSCAVLMFRLLFCGLHPYDQRNGADTIEEEISSKSFPYPENINGDFSKIPWGGYDEMWKHTPFQIQTFFYEIFKNGYRYSTQEMILMLRTYYEFLNLKKEQIPSLNEISFLYE